METGIINVERFLHCRKFSQTCFQFVPLLVHWALFFYFAVGRILVSSIGFYFLLNLVQSQLEADIETTDVRRPVCSTVLPSSINECLDVFRHSKNFLCFTIIFFNLLVMTAHISIFFANYIQGYSYYRNCSFEYCL